MNATQVYALLNKKIKGLTSGIKSASVNGTTITFTMNDNSTQTMIFQQPDDGVSITDVNVDSNNELFCTLSDGTSISAGKIQMPEGSNYELDTVMSDTSENGVQNCVIKAYVDSKVVTEVTTQVATQIETQVKETVQESVQETLEDQIATDDDIDSMFS